jgi:hypothetical protein
MGLFFCDFCASQLPDWEALAGLDWPLLFAKWISNEDYDDPCLLPASLKTECFGDLLLRRNVSTCGCGSTETAAIQDRMPNYIHTERKRLCQP